MKLRLFCGRFSICSWLTLVPISDVLVSTRRRPVIGRTAPRVATVTNAAGEVTRLVFIKHPSSFFSWEKWGRFLQEELPGYRHWLDVGEVLAAY